MAARAVIVFLIKIFPLFFLLLVVWQHLGLSGAYHKIIAAALNVLYPLFDPTGLADTISAERGSILVRIVYKGKYMETLCINGEDITSNTAMFLSLYLASPIRIHWRKYVVFFASSAFIMFLFHCLTVAMTIRYSFMMHPEIVRRFPYKMFTFKLVDSYVYFFEIIGMYLIILALWFPYIILCLSEVRRRAKPSSIP